MVWSVDTNKLRQIPGSKDDKLRRMIGGRFKRDLASLDDLFEHRIAAGGPNTYEALRQIVDGTIPEGVQNGAIYRYAFKLIVDHLGTFLDNNAVCPIGSDFGDIDRALVRRVERRGRNPLEPPSAPQRLRRISAAARRRRGAHDDPRRRRERARSLASTRAG